METASTADTAAQLLQVLEGAGWRVGPAHSDATPDLIYWPVHLRHEATAIHFVQSIVAARFSALGCPVVLALEDIGLEEDLAAAQAFEEQVNVWFGLVDGSRKPEVDSLRDFANTRGIDYWPTATNFFGQQSSDRILTGLKIAMPSEGLTPDAFRELVAGNMSRIITPLYVWPHISALLASRPDANRIVTLGGQDKDRLWAMFGDASVGRLSHPQNILPQTHLPALTWQHPEDIVTTLQHAREIGNTAGGIAWNNPTHPFRWMIEQVVLLGSKLTGRANFAVDWEAVEQQFARPEADLTALSSALASLFFSQPDTAQIK